MKSTLIFFFFLNPTTKQTLVFLIMESDCLAMREHARTLVICLSHTKMTIASVQRRGLFYIKKVLDL